MSEYTEQEKQAAMWIAAEAMQGNENAQTVMNMLMEAEQLRTQQGGEAPFIVEDYKPFSGEVYQYTLRHRATGESLAPLTSEQASDMKMLLQSWFEVRTPPAPVPEGYVMVPVEPTGDMIDAYDMSNNGCIGNSLCPDGYRAMLKAAQGGE